MGKSSRCAGYRLPVGGAALIAQALALVLVTGLAALTLASFIVDRITRRP